LKKTPKHAKKTGISATKMHWSAQDGALGTQKQGRSSHAHTKGCQSPETVRHMRLAHGLGAWHMKTCEKVTFCDFFTPKSPCF